MTDKPIMIDGINVSECEAYKDEHCKDKTSIMFCNTNLCSNFPNCYFKQLAREKQKLGKIKEILKIHKDSKCAICPKFDECFDHPSCDNIILQIIDSKDNR